MNLHNQVATHLEYGKRLETEVQAYCNDTTVNLEKRWDLFCSSGFGEESSWTEDFTALDKIHKGKLSWYDDYFIDRHQTVLMCELIEQIEQAMFSDEYDENTEEEFLIKLSLTTANYEPSIKLVNELKEEILHKWVKSFIHDW